MSKLSKLKNNPKLFFKDSYEKRREQLKKIANVLTEENLSQNQKPLQVKDSKRITKKHVAKPVPTGYRYYLENYTQGSIQKNLVLFDSFWGRKIGCHPYAIYRAMKASKNFDNYEFIWVRENGVDVPIDILEDKRVNFVIYSSIEYASALMRAEILISNSNFSPYFSPKPEQYVVSTWHGIPMKTLGYDANHDLEPVYNTQRNFNISDLIVSSSSFFTDKVVKAYGAYLSLSATQKIGSPRIDLMLNANVQEVKEALNIPLERKTILYAPTWRGKIGEVSNDIEIQLELITYLENIYSENYEILVSLHHLTKKSLGDDFSNLKIREVPSNIDINEILSICDIVVSDYSSIYLDFLCLDRPVVLYIPDIEEYKLHRGLYLAPDELPVNVAKNIEELAQCIESPKNPSDFSSYQYIIDSLLPFEDGHSSERVIEKILAREVNSYKHLVKKENVLISVGGLNSSGITKSLSNLLNNIDYDRYNIFLLINAKLVDTHFEKQINLNHLNKKAKQILTIAPKNLSSTQKQAYQRLSNGKKISGAESYQINIAFEREMRRLVGKFTFDHAIDYTGYSVYWASCMASVSAKNRIIFQHSDKLAEAHNAARGHKSLYGVFQKYKNFDKLVSVSLELLELNKLSLSGYAKENSFYYLPNLLSVEEISQGANAPLSIMSPKAFMLNMEKGVIKFVCVARLSPEKGHNLLLHAFKKVIDAGVNASLSIIGSGMMEKELKKQCQLLGIENRVIFHGHINNPYPIVSHSDCLILVSEYEGQGLVYLEAMTLGIPCIGSNIPVVRDLITPHGGVVADLNAESVSEAMIAFSKKPPTVTGFNPEKYINKNLDILYNEILTISQ
ncbi:CDP-glycerol glycerophosphotransferase family protein [Psychrobacter celer]|uniref:CDP-glycerol glycerophosphotransferase family protein n=1 Tax=Psychrobacter celer TaxID=306572 RepID=UPI003FD586D9